jgi:predicted dehydrogenase
MAQGNKIRVALIGLSASAKVSWAAEAHLPYLLSERGRSHYEVVALLNSSVAAAESARATYNLPSSVKAYGDPTSLAADPDIDLVVVNTRVDVHFETVAPSLRAHKGVYIEWPITENLTKALELTGDKPIPNSIIGLQGRVSPITLRVKEVLTSGAIGTVLSSQIQAYGNLLQRDALPSPLTYFADRKVGGHPINIHFGHLIDYAHEVLGEFKEFESRMQLQRPTLKITDADWKSKGDVKGEVKSDVPDFLAIHGALQGGSIRGSGEVVQGATLAATFRYGQAFPNEPGLTWSIAGTKGELLIKAPGPYLMSDSYNGPITIQVHDHESDEVKELGWDWQEWQKDLPIRARIVAELYERYAEWIEAGKGAVVQGREWPRLDDAVLRMREFDGIYRQFDPQW